MSGSVPPPGGDPRYGSGQPAVPARSEPDAAAPAPSPAAPAASPDSPARPAVSPDHLSTNLLRAVAVLAVLLIAVVVNSLLHGGEEGDGINPVAQAAVKTQRLPGARFSVEATYTSPATGKEVTATGEGVYEAEHRRTDLRMDVNSFSIETLGDEQNMYFRIEGQDQHLPPGKVWIGVEPFLGHSAEEALATGGGLDSRMQLLEAAGGQVDSLGEEEVRGVLTHRYSVKVDPTDVADTLEAQGNSASARLFSHLTGSLEGPIESEVWIDDAGLMRRMSEVMTMKVDPSQPPIRMDMKMDLFDFGHQSHIPLPKPSEVVDLTPLVKAEQHLTDGTAFGLLRPPAGAAALTTKKFRQRVDGICQGLEKDGKRIAREGAAQIEAMKRLGAGGPGSVSPEEALPVFRDYIRNVYRPVEKRSVRLLRELAAVPPPAADAGRYDRFLRNGAEQVEILRGEITGYSIGEFKIGSKLKPGKKKLSDESDAIARKLHLPACVGHGDEESDLGDSAPSTNPA